MTSSGGPTDEQDGSRLDGNAAAGPLRELFAVDLTRARFTCAGCGTTGPLAEQPLFQRAPALVLRCSGCEAVLLRYSEDGPDLRLDVTGIRLLAVPREPAGST